MKTNYPAFIMLFLAVNFAGLAQEKPSPPDVTLGISLSAIEVAEKGKTADQNHLRYKGTLINSSGHSIVLPAFGFTVSLLRLQLSDPADEENEIEIRVPHLMVNPTNEQRPVLNPNETQEFSTPYFGALAMSKASVKRLKYSLDAQIAYARVDGAYQTIRVAGDGYLTVE